MRNSRLDSVASAEANSRQQLWKLEERSETGNVIFFDFSSYSSSETFIEFLGKQQSRVEQAPRTSFESLDGDPSPRVTEREKCLFGKWEIVNWNWKVQHMPEHEAEERRMKEKNTKLHFGRAQYERRQRILVCFRGCKVPESRCRNILGYLNDELLHTFHMHDVTQHQQ